MRRECRTRSVTTSLRKSQAFQRGEPARRSRLLSRRRGGRHFCFALALPLELVASASTPAGSARHPCPVALTAGPDVDLPPGVVGRLGLD